MKDKKIFKPGDLLVPSNRNTAKFYYLIMFLEYFDPLDDNNSGLDCMVLDLQENKIIKGRIEVIQKNFKHLTVFESSNEKISENI